MKILAEKFTPVSNVLILVCEHAVLIHVASGLCVWFTMINKYVLSV